MEVAAMPAHSIVLARKSAQDPVNLPVAYSSWYETPVVLRVATARTRMQTELHCTIKGESDAVVHVHIGQRDQDIRKKMILAVEENLAK
jgi:hypothetical protein